MRAWLPAGGKRQSEDEGTAVAETIRLRIRRRDRPDSDPYWQEFAIPFQPRLNVVSALMVVRYQRFVIFGAM